VDDPGRPSAAASNAINEQAFVRIGGIEQWISIRGDNRDNPVILVLHGGPASATLLSPQR
jgi:hypothetical protein